MRIPFAAVVIIIVTALAFVAGYAQNQFAASSNEYERVAARIEEKSRFLKDLDRGYYYESLNLFTEAAVIAIKYWAIEVNGPGLTAKELIEYQLDFVQKVWDANNLVVSTVAVEVIHSTFISNPTTQECVLAEKKKDGYDYIITRDHWEKYQPLVTVSKQVFLSTFMALGPILADITYLTDEIDTYTYPAPYVFYRLDWDNIAELYGGPLNDATAASIKLQDIANQITMAVSVTTIATVLATAMASRVDNKETEHSFSVIHDGMNIPAAKRKGSRDKLAYLGLLLAVFISAGGLILPVILMLAL
ncbi:MAG: hypothetical protein ACFFD4_16750 [Candidatus Odinarchaeota archaeon]